MEAVDLIKGAIDIHIHIGPDPNCRRRVNGYEAAVQAREAGMRGLVFKSHVYNTTPVAYTVQQLVSEIALFGGVSLNVEVGGLNPQAVEAAGKLGAKIVWMPTFSSRNDMKKRNIIGKGISIFDENKHVLPAVSEILALIKQYDMVLSSGHLSRQEIFALLQEAQARQIDRILITHPLAIRVGPTLSIDDQQKMRRPGVYFEHCFHSCMPNSDRLDPQAIADAIRAVGPEHCILSTDFGQIVNPPPVEGLRMCVETMLQLGITRDEIMTMIKINPAKVLGLSDP